MSEDAELVIVAISIVFHHVHLSGDPKNAPPDTSWTPEKWSPSDIGKRKAGRVSHLERQAGQRERKPIRHQRAIRRSWNRQKEVRQANSGN